MNADRTAGNNPPGVIELQAYPPSWFDKLNHWLDLLPGPIWLGYLCISLLLFSIWVLIQLLENSFQSVKIHPIVVISHFQIVYVLSLIAYLDKQTFKALEEFRPILKLNDSAIQSLQYRLITLPAQPMRRLTIITIVILVVIGFGMVNIPSIQSEVFPLSQVMIVLTKSTSGVFALAVWSLLWLINIIFIYHTFHQLKTIDHIYRHHAEVNLFRQTELYAFSRLSASTAIGFVLTSPLWLAIDPGIITMIVNIIFAIIAIFIFISPLSGAHRLLKVQKDALVKESLLKKENLIMDLFSQLDGKNLRDIGNLERAFSSLDKAHTEIEKISTWPWRTDTIRQLIGALLIPITIWIIQYFLAQSLAH